VIVARPMALLLLLGAVPIVWAYLRRAPPQRVLASSLLLLRAAAAAPSRRRRLDRMLSLLLVLGTLLAVSLGLALEPAPATRPVVVVLDTSASMGAAAGPGQGTRLDAARDALDGWLDHWPDAPVTLLQTPPLRTLLVDVADPTAVQRLAASMVPAGEHADPTPLLRGLCAGDAPPAVLLLSDQLALPDDLACPVHRPDLGAPPANGGVTDLVARSADGLGLTELQVETAGPGPLTVAIDGGPARPVAAPGGLLWLSLPQGGRVTVSGPPDPHAADDAATLTLSSPGAVRATVVTDDPRGYASLALGAHPRVALTVQGPDAPLSDTDLLVLEVAPSGSLPAARRTLALGIDPAVVGAERGPPRAEPTVSAQADHPLLRWVELSDLHITRSAVLPVPAGGVALLSSDEGALVVTAPRAGGAALVLTGFSLRDTDLALRAAWVNLIANLVEAAGAAPEVVRGQGLLSTAESAPAVAGAGLPTRPLQAAFGLAGLLAFLLLTAETAAAWRRRRSRARA